MGNVRQVKEDKGGGVRKGRRVLDQGRTVRRLVGLHPLEVRTQYAFHMITSPG